MKKLYLFAALAAMLAACSENDLTKDTAVQQNAEEGAVQFSAYMNRGTTRAGAPGTLTTAGTSTNLKNVSLQTDGFGVLAYYCDGEPYSENSKPDFMYNQKVTYNTTASAWGYNPVKYWPNEFGSEAISEGTDRLTFFAYAPYVDVDLTTGLATGESTTGIIALTRNTTHGDPFVKYYADFNPEKRVDLCWGVAKSAFVSSVTGTDNNVEAGKPYIDVVKPKLSDKINFDFKHALAALNVTIDADIDEAGHGTNNYADGTTKIWVRSITFEGFADKGMLNLNGTATDANYTPEWYDLSGNNKIGSGGKTTIHDGLRDGSEPLGEASNEIPAALNPQIIQSEVYSANPYTTLTTASSLTGVPSYQTVNLFNSTTSSEPIYVIPTNDDLKVTIVYDVETADKNLTNYLADGAVRGSCVENKITKEIKLQDKKIKLQAGKLYTIALHLGMTSVKFEASVTEWGDAQVTDDTWLPVNAPTASVAAGSTDGEVTISADKYKGSLQVTGLTAGADVAFTQSSNITPKTATPVKADANGTININFEVAANTTISDRDETITLTSPATTFTIKQKAHALALQAPTIAADGITITLTSGATGMAWSGNESMVKITGKNKDGIALTPLVGDADEGTGKVKVTGATATATLVLPTAVAAGDVLTITVDPNDATKAAKESVTLKIGGIAFAPATAAIEYGQKGFTYAPIVYGQTPSGYTVTPAGTPAIVELEGTTLKAVAAGGPVEVTVVATQDATPDTYAYTTGSKTAVYDLTVNKAVGTISYEGKIKTGVSKAESADALTADELATAKLKNSRGDALTVGADDGGAVTYTLVSVNGDPASTLFSISSNKLVTGSGLTGSTTYTVVVRANVTSNTNVMYADESATATFTLTTAP